MGVTITLTKNSHSGQEDVEPRNNKCIEELHDCVRRHLLETSCFLTACVRLQNRVPLLRNQV
ncbi:hypothetical protein SCLCIDRAFT_916034 [Scleroderma citrinum Foug A]|uniref:Uncharacterized protein n=1 Tax=Scleroderma citrinum Foug A TaxID=1036808 RepID=A0A0C3DKD8_9AGAM|nr:hypothetical protein SCLCIDRAFT_916034 [Scleroderma citrinum Foug A]